MTDSETRLLARLTDTEDALVERKRNASDREEIREVVVAFANSVVAPDTGVLFLGVEKDGSISGLSDADASQRDVTKFLQRCYPPIRYQQFALTVQGKSVVAVEVPESTNPPHFAGKATVRVGSETRDATLEEYRRLLDNHSSKVRLLNQHLGKPIMVLRLAQHGNVTVPTRWAEHFIAATLKEVTPFWVVWDHKDTSQPPDSAPMEEVSLSWGFGCLRLHVQMPRAGPPRG